MLVDIDTIMRVFCDNSTYSTSKNKEKVTQLKVPIPALQEFSHFFSFSLGETL